ncbi:hypothetical protein EHQ12_18835 [Leptospira gomenensis]|uniref:Glycosyltransferase n=1 Tax=Leptospira gomenensis TaxID=2484974 RepID=A0A5F1Y7K3_9LEPT|nr:hypothetical protein [Leptospira gomenensis]TGK30908.1 hypothetical protein EHQ17_14380 [Leptospira gomenensis]TGK32546.1 hypothetical protein EHQ12_18835 [Leptospira gomenensis]TGK45372.1 hypothetical protein EHQ07_10615 [Leptospira gomenensis]TGK60636.1 hypothetical protein EHQ13_11190 [Leptospira gomenensis]
MNFCLITAHPWVAISTPVIETVKFLASKGDTVRLLVQLDPGLEKIGLKNPELNHPNVEVIQYKGPSIVAGRISKLPAFLQEFIYGIYILVRFFGICRRSDFLIGYDPQGIIRTGIVSFVLRIPFAYHSLELYHRDRSFFLSLAKVFARQARFSLIQDRNRLRILRVISGLRNREIIILKNSSAGSVLRKKENYFRNRFPISPDKRIALVTGTLLRFSGVDRILDSLSNWPKNWVLVLHGWIPDSDFKEEVLKKISTYEGKVFLSSEILPAEEKFSVFQSVDLCFVWFAPADINLKYAAGSAGKYYDSLKCGLPMIGNRIPMMKKLMKGVGLVAETESEIADSIAEIESKYELFRDRAFDVFEDQEFGKSFEIVYKKIKNVVK